MRKTFIVTVAIASFIFVAATTVPPALLRNDAPALEVEISLAPVSQDTWQLLRRPTPGTYRCSVFVHDEPGSRRIWGTKNIVIARGESGQDTAKLGPLELNVTATLDRSGERAQVVATVSREGKVINRQRSTVSLSRT